MSVSILVLTPNDSQCNLCSVRARGCSPTALHPVLLKSAAKVRFSSVHMFYFLIRFTKCPEISAKPQTFHAAAPPADTSHPFLQIQLDDTCTAYFFYFVSAWVHTLQNFSRRCCCGGKIKEKGANNPRHLLDTQEERQTTSNYIIVWHVTHA